MTYLRKLAPYFFGFAMLAPIAACNSTRHTTRLTYAGDARRTTGPLEDEIAMRGFKPICKEGKYCKFQVEENLWVHIKTSEKKVVLAVDVKGAKEMAPEEAEKLKVRGETVGGEIWAAASERARAIEEQERVAAAQKAKEEEERAANEPAAAPFGGGFNLGKTMNDMSPRNRRSKASSPSSNSTNEKSSSARCCVNGAYYACPDAASLNKCGGNFARCAAGCMSSSDMSCADRCLEKHPPNPSGCERQTARDNEC